MVEGKILQAAGGLRTKAAGRERVEIQIVVIENRLPRSGQSQVDGSRGRRRKSARVTELFRERLQRMETEMRSNGMVGLARALTFLAFWLVQVPPAAGHKSGLP